MAPPDIKKSNTDNQKPTHSKLPRLSKNSRISKRPLLHPPIPSHSKPTSKSGNNQKVIYVSASTPFISTVKRVRKLLSSTTSRSQTAVLEEIERGVISEEKGGNGEVILKGTGRAIEKVLRMVIYWQGQGDVRVVVRTGSVGAVDDVVSVGPSHRNQNDEKDGAEGEEGNGGDGGVEGGEGEEEEEEGSRIRRISCLEVGISLR